MTTTVAPLRIQRSRALQLKENYFGGFTHFVTLEEYRHRHERNLQGDPLELKYRPGKTDAFEVTVAYELDGGLLLLPQGALQAA